MERQLQLRFPDAGLCFHQGSEGRKEVEALFSCGYYKPYLAIQQQPQKDFFIMQNLGMNKPIKQIMAERLDHLK